MFWFFGFLGGCVCFVFLGFGWVFFVVFWLFFLKSFPQYVQLCGGAGVLVRIEVRKVAEHGSLGRSVQEKSQRVRACKPQRWLC